MTVFSDIKARLAEATKGEYTDGFSFAVDHRPDFTHATLSNGDVGEILAL